MCLTGVKSERNRTPQGQRQREHNLFLSRKRVSNGERITQGAMQK